MFQYWGFKPALRRSLAGSSSRASRLAGSPLSGASSQGLACDPLFGSQIGGQEDARSQPLDRTLPASKDLPAKEGQEGEFASSGAIGGGGLERGRRCSFYDASFYQHSPSREGREEL